MWWELSWARDLIAFHKSHNKVATVTSIQLDARFGGMEISENGDVKSFREKVKDSSKWINAGFFVLRPSVFKYLDGNMYDTMWEDEPLEKITADGEMAAFKHRGFWKCMDAQRDKIELETLWQNDKAKWKTW